MARRSRAKCGGEFTRNKSSNQEPQAIRAMRMVATQAGNTMIWMMVASLARVISTLPTMSKLLRCQAARASGGAGGDDTAGAGASLTGRRSDEVWRVAMRAVTTAAETERRLVPRAIGPIGGETQSITVVKNLLRWLMLGRFGCACKRAGKRLRGCFRRKHGVKGGATQPPAVTQTVKETRMVATREGDVMTEAAERRSGTRGDENPMKPVQRAGRGRRWCCFDGKSRTQQRGLVKRVKVPVDP
ncbi:hypothetical protein PC129_g10907 [Phytophthora cactorum]|uniref:Uncharacterized protein n=1 Tax=Phytophthora cactorum TaxID=29920 RepID=A0A8T0YYE6_9STRA|nr:hypothetical protein PC112_g19098 [Phytophthora cactorum]KAG2804539.1 hypothetical protein PC111_g18210 [Phytophthora cactorum]KAG2854668.1 hypothetical protein PC113_g13100 [Phytophthora cactorum]KAG2917765.1 hypothetical protein PC114_g7032 [Phytophthora cactorum]KAG2947231.1 hypothetical protein PC117_g6974 [Phytophthora cactorum]